MDHARQQQGHGRTLLADWLAEVDRDATAAYLETDRPENVAFYTRAGFAAVGETRIFAVPVWRMLRPPVSAPLTGVSGARPGARH